jgi:hypothetical protein
MANDNTNPLVAYAEARIAAWQAVLASVKSALTLDPGGLTVEGFDLPSTTQGGDLGQPIDLPQGAFMGKSVPACIELYLSAVKKKKTNKEIVDALREGGVESNSKLDNTVNAALFKLKSNGVALRFKDGWGLSSWYPAHIRAVTPAASKRAKKKAKKSGRKDLPAKTNAASPAPAKGKVNERIIQLLQAKPEREYSLEAIAEHLGMGVRGARLSLGKMLKAGRVKMSAPGMYMVGRPQLVAAGA